MRWLASLAALVLSFGPLAACEPNNPPVGPPSPEMAVSLFPTPPPAVSAVAPRASALPPTSWPGPIPPPERPRDWELFEDPGYGFEFRYPPACPLTRHEGALYVGGQIQLAIEDAAGLGLNEYVRRFLDQRTSSGGWRLESQQSEAFAGNPAVRIEYRFGGTGRYGTALFLEREGRIYIWGLTAGGFTCDEPDVYDDIVASFRFTNNLSDDSPRSREGTKLDQ